MFNSKRHDYGYGHTTIDITDNDKTLIDNQSEKFDNDSINRCILNSSSIYREYQDTKYCLSLQGGGKRGYATVLFLSVLEKLGINILEKFDMFGGCSVGAMIAAALVTGTNAEELFFKVQEQMKNPNTLVKTTLHSVPFMMKYKGTGKRRMINKLIPPVNMKGEPLYDHQKPIKMKDLVVATYQTTSAQACYFTTGMKHSIRDVIDASTAAPTYFPPIIIDDNPYIDGGVATNDVSMFLYARARRKWPNSRIKILNVGTGRYRCKFKTSSRPGMIELFQSGLHHVIANASNDVTDFISQSLLGRDYFHVNTDMIKNIQMDGTDPQHFHDLAIMAHEWSVKYATECIKFLN